MIRRATDEDVETIVSIFEPSFGTLDFLPALHAHEEHLSFFRRCVAEGEAWLLDRGFAIVSGNTLTHLYVHPDATGAGVGHSLLEHVKSRRPDGFDLWDFQQNAGARRFYEQHGLRCVELTDGSRNEERTPDARYEWRPVPGSSAR